MDEDPSLGQPSMATNEENTNAVQSVICANRHVFVRKVMLAE